MVQQYVRAIESGELAVLVSLGVTIAHILSRGIALATGESAVVRAGAAANTTLVTLG